MCVREIDDDEGKGLLRMIRRGSGSVVTWRRALRALLREESVSFQRVKTWKISRDPEYVAKMARVEHYYAIVDGEVILGESEPEVVLCLDEFGPINLQHHPGRQWAERGERHKNPARGPGSDGRRPTPARTGSGICSPPTAWPGTSSAATSSRRRTEGQPGRRLDRGQ